MRSVTGGPQQTNQWQRPFSNHNFCICICICICISQSAADKSVATPFSNVFTLALSINSHTASISKEEALWPSKFLALACSLPDLTSVNQSGADILIEWRAHCKESKLFGKGNWNSLKVITISRLNLARTRTRT